MLRSWRGGRGKNVENSTRRDLGRSKEREMSMTHPTTAGAERARVCYAKRCQLQEKAPSLFYSGILGGLYSLGDSLSDSSEELFPRGKGGAGVCRNFCSNKERKAK